MNKGNYLLLPGCVLILLACSVSRKQATDRQFQNADSLQVTWVDSTCHRQLSQFARQGRIYRQEVRFFLPDSTGRQYPEMVRTEEAQLNYQSVAEDTFLQQTAEQVISTHKTKKEEHNQYKNYPSRIFILTIFVGFFILVYLICYLWRNR